MIPSQELNRFWIVRHNSLRFFYSRMSSGKWCILVPRSKVDELWQKIETAVADNRLLSAKVSTRLYTFSNGKGTHAICVYTSDWKNQTELLETLEVIRSLGVDTPLLYKRDIMTIKHRNFYTYKSPSGTTILPCSKKGFVEFTSK